MKIVLHAAEFNNLFGVVCSLVTLSGYSHASIIDDEGRRWDTTFLRGYFDIAPSLSDEPDREIVIVDIPAKNPLTAIQRLRGSRYDVIGLLFWPFRKECTDRLYCFEAVDEVLKAAGINLSMGKKKSGGLILDGLLKLGFKAYITKGRYYEHY